jgi:hypothetical protein
MKTRNRAKNECGRYALPWQETLVTAGFGTVGIAMVAFAITLGILSAQ